MRSEGVVSLWKGFTPYYLRVGPHTVLTFIFFEQVSREAREAMKARDARKGMEAREAMMARKAMVAIMAMRAGASLTYSPD